MLRVSAATIVLLLLPLVYAWCFEVDTSPQPAGHPPISPDEGEPANTNPPSMIWRVDERAASYILEMSRDPAFERDVIRVEGIDLPFYNHAEVLPVGEWSWRYFVVNEAGEVSEPSPVRTFIITAVTPPMPVPPTDEIIDNMPGHPRIFVTPDTLEEFRARRETIAQQAWEQIRWRADAELDSEIPNLELRPMPEDPGSSRKQVFYLRDGEPLKPANFDNGDLNAAGARVNYLSLAYLISGDERYADAAKRWMLFMAPFRMDYHLEDRGQHDTVVYNYEYGLKGYALGYDRLYDRLSEAERAAILDHLEYHCANAYAWVRDRLELHLNYQNSHGQQCMHALLTTVLAIADESEDTRRWADWLIRQYVNRIAWGDEDGGYSEGQTYSHKFQFILEGLAALRTATGIDVFQKPRLRNAGDFWMYCMSLNYWWNHWGDVYSLLMAVPGASADTYISAFLASMTGSRYVKWWSDTVVGSPDHIPLRYLSTVGIRPKPPVDIAQARLFPDVGQLAAYDRFYDHRSNRIFFRSSPWGGHSHAHADQNSFVLHAGGEIMAMDSGYYTYYGDEYHRNFSVTTNAHNSILVNGEGQPKSINSKGRVATFLNTADYCLFLGDAAEAYPEALSRFDRIVLMIRPDVFVVYDELEAPEPSTYSWLLNTVEEAQIDEQAREMIVSQGDQRVRVTHLAPDDLTYTQSNERPYPMLTRRFCRYTEAFPQPYHIRVTTGKGESERILTVMDAYEDAAGPTVEDLRLLSDSDPLALAYRARGLSEAVILRDRDSAGEMVTIGGIETDARVATIARDADGEVVRWLLHDGTHLAMDGRPIFSADAPCDAAGQMQSPAGRALVHVKPHAHTTIRVALASRPSLVMAAPPDAPDQAVAHAYDWRAGCAEIALSGVETVLWVDPARDLTEPPPPLTLAVTDSNGTYSLELEAAVADNGEIVAFGRFDPREAGDYAFAASDDDAEILVQDRWDIMRSVRGRGRIEAHWREGAEIFVRYRPDRTPDVSATLRKSYRGEVVNVLRNGGFEEGSRNFPPRTWTISHPREMGMTWPHWTQEDATEGESCVKFVRPEIPMTLRSQPMRLQTGGTYVLSFAARGNATEASVAVSGQRGTLAEIEVEPGDDWREYRTRLEVEPGYTVVEIRFAAGGEPDQVLWIDDVRFGYVAK